MVNSPQLKHKPLFVHLAMLGNFVYFSLNKYWSTDHFVLGKIGKLIFPLIQCYNHYRIPSFL